MLKLLVIFSYIANRLLRSAFFDLFRSNTNPKRGRAPRRPAPYRPPSRNFSRETSNPSWVNDLAPFPPFPAWSPGIWTPPKSNGQPLPPGEDKQPQRFGPPPDGSKIRCFSCFKFGHKSPNCPDKQTQ